jgi:prepilin-type N-terminal cleavage/methylation domain-containing protein
MSESFHKSSGRGCPRGFTLVELLVAMGLSLILLGIGFSIFSQLNDVSDLAGTIADVNENLRAGVNMIARDLSTAGAGITLVGGIPLPGGGSGATAAVAVSMPGPGGRTFDTGAGGYIPVITPGSAARTGASVGPTNGGLPVPPGIPTDVVTMIGVNPISNLGQYPLASITPNTFTGAPPTSVTITLNAAFNMASMPVPVTQGQLIMLVNSSACLLAVSSFNTTAKTITFTHSDQWDFLHLNQFPGTNGPTTGTVAQLPPTASQTTAYQLNMITYYLDNTNLLNWKLMKVVGAGSTWAGSPAVQTSTATVVAMGINVLQFTYDVYSATGVVTPNQVTGISPNQIRKVNLWMISKADHPRRGTRTYYTNSIATSVVIQNLAYYNKY